MGSPKAAVDASWARRVTAAKVNAWVIDVAEGHRLFSAASARGQPAFASLPSR